MTLNNIALKTNTINNESKKANKYLTLDNSQGKGENKNLKTKKGMDVINSVTVLGIINSLNAILDTLEAPSVFFALRYSKDALEKYSEMKNSCENIARQIVKVINPKMKFFLNNRKTIQNINIGRICGLNKTQTMKCKNKKTIFLYLKSKLKIFIEFV